MCTVFFQFFKIYLTSAFYDKFENVKEALKNHDTMLDYISLFPFVNFDAYTKPCCIRNEL